jgi:O-antigen/teichoic acid export membrane protein
VIQKCVLSAALANWTEQVIALASGFFLAPFILHRIGDTQYGILILVGSVTRYAEYAPITILLTMASILELSSRSGGQILLGLGRHHGLAVITVCTAFANVGLSLLLVRPYGLIGVATGTFVSTKVLTFGWKLSYVMRSLTINPRELATPSLMPVLWPFLLDGLVADPEIRRGALRILFRRFAQRQLVLALSALHILLFLPANRSVNSFGVRSLLSRVV